MAAAESLIVFGYLKCRGSLVETPASAKGAPLGTEI